MIGQIVNVRRSPVPKTLFALHWLKWHVPKDVGMRRFQVSRNGQPGAQLIHVTMCCATRLLRRFESLVATQLRPLGGAKCARVPRTMLDRLKAVAAGFDSLGKLCYGCSRSFASSAATLFSERFLPRCLAVSAFNAVAIFIFFCRVYLLSK